MEQGNAQLNALLELERRIKTNDPSVANLAPEKKAAIEGRLKVYREQGLAKPLSESALTEAQGKATGYYNAAINANQRFEKSGATGPRNWFAETLHEWTPNVLNSLPAAIGNSPGRQKADQAALDFIMATLRQESGAALNNSEIYRQYQRYFPMPGDSGDVLKQKQQSRLNAIEGLKVASGSGASRVESEAAPVVSSGNLRKGADGVLEWHP